MSCNNIIHDEMKNNGEVICPFCDCKIQESSRKDLSCCDNQKMFNDNEKEVCLNCGIIECYNSVSEYVSFHENK